MLPPRWCFLSSFPWPPSLKDHHLPEGCRVIFCTALFSVVNSCPLACCLFIVCLSTPPRRKWQLTPVLLPRKFHGWRSLVGYSPWSHKESDMTEWLPFHFLFLTPKELAGFNNMAKTLLDIVLLFFPFLMGITWNRTIINSVLETVIELQRTTKSKDICNNPDMKKAIIFPELKIYKMKWDNLQNKIIRKICEDCFALYKILFDLCCINKETIFPPVFK